MELGAVIEAFKYLADRPEAEGADIEVRTDSTYVTNAFNKDWIRNWRRDGWDTRTNGHLWAELDRLIEGRNITWTWVKGHGRDRMNNRCDALAVEMSHKAASADGYWAERTPANGGRPAEPKTGPERANTEDDPPIREPNRGHPVKDALVYNSRAGRLAKIILEKSQAGEPEEAERALSLALDQLARQEAILTRLIGGRPSRGHGNAGK